MGGGKKPTAAKKDKSEKAKDSKKGEGGPRKAEIVVLVNEQQAIKIIQNSKVITVQDLARQTGIKISAANAFLDRKSTRLNSSHKPISYAVFCLKKKIK